MQPDARFIYKEIRSAKLELFVFHPPGWAPEDRRPAMIFFYGGGWSGGDIKRLMPCARHFADLGMVTVCADYRVRSRHRTAPDACVEDAKSAVRWMRANAMLLGIDPERLVAAGDSAGGHIAACTATIVGFEATGEDAAVSCAGNVLVLLNPRLDVVARQLRDGRIGSLELAKAISPSHHLRSGLPPTLILHGTDDEQVPFAQSVAFVEQMRALGNRAELFVAEHAGHSFWTKEPWKTSVLPVIETFLTSLGYLPVSEEEHRRGRKENVSGPETGATVSSGDHVPFVVSRRIDGFLKQIPMTLLSVHGQQECVGRHFRPSGSGALLP